jgi:DNA-binding transcriptional regulator YiaG
MSERYQYTGCGLDYVYLLNGYTIHKTPHGEGVSIKEGRQLHEAIARNIVSSPYPLRGQEVRFLRSLLRLSQEGLARALRHKRGSVARWEADPNKRIPAAADTSLRMFYALKADRHEVAIKLVDLLTELDEPEHKLHTMQRDLQLKEEEGEWMKKAA